MKSLAQSIRKQKSDCDEEMGAIERGLEALALSKASLEKFVRFAELMLADIPAAWQQAKAEQRQRVQNLLFPEGLLYSQEKGF